MDGARPLLAQVNGAKVLTMNRVTLYSLMTDKISVTVQAYFDRDGNLVIEGRDIGRTVEEMFGDSDYEYSSVVRRDNLETLNAACGLPSGSREELLVFLKTRYNTNGCYSQIQSELTRHDIPFEKFSWM